MSLWQFIVLLPKLIEAFERLSKLLKDRDVAKWLNDLNTAIDKAEVANDSKSRKEAASELADVISRL